MMEENGLPKGWVETTLGEVATYINRGITPKYTEDKGMYILNQRCIRDRKVSYENSRFNNSDLRKVPFDKIVQELDVLICSTGVGTLGRVAQIKKVKEPTTVDSHVTIIRPNNDVDKLYLGHLLGGKEREIEHLAEGSTGQTELPRKKLEVFPILIPKSIPEQKAIASILTSFDDKIELLQAQNETLETIAQTIFKEWFGKYKVGDELPEGWRVGKLGDAVNIKQGKYVKSSKISETKSEANKFPVYGGGGIRGYLSDYIYGTPQVVLTCRGNGCGLIQLSESYSTVTNSCMALEDIDSELNFIYIYLQSQNLDFESVTSGSAQPQITVTNLRGTEIIIPNESVLLEFNDVAKPLFQKMSFNTIQIQTLQATRDTLLPKLMSGKVRVEEFRD